MGSLRPRTGVLKGRATEATPGGGVSGELGRDLLRDQLEPETAREIQMGNAAEVERRSALNILAVESGSDSWRTVARRRCLRWSFPIDIERRRFVSSFRRSKVILGDSRW